VPSSFLAQSLYVAAAISGFIYLVWKIKIYAIAMNNIIGTGMVMSILSLATGAIWGRPTWGSYWVWDARLTSMLLLLFIYIGILLLKNSFNNEKDSFKACSVMALVGLVNIPIIKFSVVWWNSLHQGATLSVSKGPAMPPEMWIPLVIAILGFYLLAVFVVLSKMKINILKLEAGTSWVESENQKLLGQK
jgi:heme exporter protein C